MDGTVEEGAWLPFIGSRVVPGERNRAALKPLWHCADRLSFFDSRRSKARRQYLQFIRTGFEQVLEAPWEKLRSGLVLGSEEFWEKVKTLVAGKPGKEELLWVGREHRVDVAAKRVAELLAQTEDERVKVWICVRLDGKRKVDVARSLGYRDGSGVLQVLKRLEAKAAEDPKLRKQLDQLRKNFSSSV